MNETFWIQAQAPAKNWYDILGLPLLCTRTQALQQLRDWRRSFPKTAYRLIVRVDVVIDPQEN